VTIVATVAFFFFGSIAAKKAITIIVGAFFFVLENFCVFIGMKNKKTTTFITFYDGFVAKKWQRLLPSPFLMVLLRRR